MTGTVTGGLAGIRVLELGEMVSAPYAAKLLADLGADVIKVEPPEGDRARHRGPFRGQPDPDASGLFLALNTNKQSLQLGTDPTAWAEQLAPLLADADIVINNLSDLQLQHWHVDLQELHTSRPELVICSITPFGRTGPHADYVAEELTVTHAGGWAYQCPGASSEVDQPPLKVFGHQADFHAGMAGAMVALAAHRRAERTGVGDLLDFSSVAHTAGMLEAALIAASYMDENPGRLGSRLLNPWGIFDASDGQIFLVTVEQDQWERLVTMMGTPEWTQMGLFDNLELRLENEDLLRIYLQEWIGQQEMLDLWHRGQAERICFAPVFSVADLAEQEHLQARGFLVDVDHPTAGAVTHLGAPAQWSDDAWGPLRPAPCLNSNAAPTFSAPRPSSQRSVETEPSRPLDGVKVLDFTWVWAGPYCTMHLAFLGAEVIKVESAQRPGLGRRLAIHPPDVEPSLNTSAYFNQWDQGKKSIDVDLTDPAALQLILDLARDCDVVVENFANGVMDRLGLGYEKLRRTNPGLVMASISGYGIDGPLADYMGYGPTTGPLSGLTSLTGYEGGGARELGIAVGDPGAGITAAFAIVAALSTRETTGEGCFIDVSLWESTASNAVEGWMTHQMTGEVPDRMGNHDPLMAPHNCYRSAGDDEWISIACPDDAAWKRLAEVIDPQLAADPRFSSAADRKRNEAELDVLVGQWCGAQNNHEATAKLQAYGVAAFSSMSPQDLLVDSHLESRGFFERLEHPEVGRRTHAGVPWISTTGPNGVLSAAPVIGQHTSEILQPREGD